MTLNNVYSFGYRAPRFRTDFRLLLQTENGNVSVQNGRCKDISEDGLAAQFWSPLEVGTAVTLVLTVPGSSKTMRIAARVTNRHHDFYGFAFIFSCQDQRSYIQAFVENLHSATLSKPHE